MKENFIPQRIITSNTLKFYFHEYYFFDTIFSIFILFRGMFFSGYWTSETTFLADVDKTVETTYYDSVTGKNIRK